MRGVIVFLAGFVAGVCFLGALFWRTGIWQPMRVAAMPPAILTAPARALPPIPEPNPLPDLRNPPAPQARLNPPPEQAVTIAPEGGPRLLIPVEGITAAQIHDNFNETRDGHKHEALDIMAARGTPVLAAVEGNIVKLFHSKPGGLTVYEFDDARKYCYYYAHLDRYAPGLKEGMLVRQGDVLGFVGSTGDAPEAAPHLHFAVYVLGPEKRWWEGTAIDPYTLLTGR